MSDYSHLPAAFGLTSEQLGVLFPFHFAIDSDLRLLRIGRSLARHCQDLRAGGSLRGLMRAIKPVGNISFEWILENQNYFFLLEHQGTGLKLRGQMLPVEKGEVIAFLGSPWLHDATELAAHGLDFEDFAIHDPVVDMLQIFQSSQMALAEAKQLAARLTQQSAELQAANVRLRYQEAEQRKLALIAARTDNSVVLTDAAGGVVWVNDGFTRLTGYALDEVIGRKPGHILQGRGTDPATVNHIREQVSRGEGFSVDILNYGKTGRNYWVAMEVQPIRNEHGELVNFMAIQSNITERRAIQQSLNLRSEVSHVLARTNNLAHALPEILQAIGGPLGWQIGIFWRVRGRRLEFAEVWCAADVLVPNFIGASRQQACLPGIGLPGRVWQSGQARWIPDVTQEGNFPRRQSAEQDGLRGALLFPVFQNATCWGVFEFFSTLVQEPDPQLLQTLTAIGSQIEQFAERCQAEELLRNTSSLQRAILEGAGYAIIATDPDGVIQLFNSAAERMLGHLAAEMIGKQNPGFFHDAREIEARARELTTELGHAVEPGFRTFVAKAELGQPDQREWTYIRKDGVRFPVLLSVTALFDEHHRVTGYLGIASDLTGRKRDEEKLRATLTEIESFNRLMINREQRVFELKEEVNNLLLAAGRPPAYPSMLTPVKPRPAFQQ